MPIFKVLKNPGFVYDLNYVFYAKFNTQLCIDMVVDETKKEGYKKYLEKTLPLFGDISDDLYIFYHATKSNHCFMTSCYMDPYKEHFATDYDFKYFMSLLEDAELMRQKLIRFYMYNLSEEELEVCFSSIEKLFSYIKKSSMYSMEEKSKLYEFLINPAPYFKSLQYELMEKEVLLSHYYKEHYETILEAHNNTTFEILCENVKNLRDLSFLQDSDQTLYTSFCLLSKYHVQLFFVSDGAVYLLGYDYVSILNALENSQRNPPLEDLCSALSETSRIQILQLLLQREEVTCKDLEKIFSFSGSTAYHHISLLTRAGAVKVRNEGKTIYYSINRNYFDNVRTELKKFSND